MIGSSSSYGGQRLTKRAFVLWLVLLTLLWPCQRRVWAEADQPAKRYQDEQAVYEACRQANRFMETQDYAQARDALLRAAAYDPTTNSAYVHGDLSECYRQLKDYPPALAEAAKALSYNPNYSRALYITALVYYNQSEWDKALDYLKRYQKTCKDAKSRADASDIMDKIQSYKDVAEASRYIAAGDDEHAIKILQQAESLSPSSTPATVHANLAFALRRSGLLEKALEENKKALALEPNDKDVIYALGVAYGDLTRFEDALPYIKRYIDLENDQARRDNAQKCLKMFEDDERRKKDPHNADSNYLWERPDSYSRFQTSDLPLKVYIASGAGVRGYRDSLPAYVRSSFDAWCQASGNRLSYEVVNDQGSADITVTWTTEAIESTPEHPWSSPSGLTEYAHGDDGRLKAHITIRTVDSFNPKRIYQDGEVAHTLLHEVGHSLGVAHSSNIKDVMYWRSAKQQGASLTARDKATIAAIYGDYPALMVVATAQPLPKAPALPKFVAPPAFMPPKPQETEKVPPMFLPPSIAADKPLPPPTFTPPSLSTIKKNDAAANPATPAFVPPPLSSKKKVVAPGSTPFFLPPPK